MAIVKDNEYIYRKQAWEDYREYMEEFESDTVLNQLNKLHNRKGYLLSDYQNITEEYYY